MGIEAFIVANHEQPIVKGAWLDRNKRRPTGGPETWHFLRYTLEDGRTFYLTADDLNDMKRRGVEPRWATQDAEGRRI